jgi:hydroxymethylpyrimidine/phosphomethylpyrimidine kinase
MLADIPTVEAVAEVFGEYSHVPFVLDPVMIAKGGHPLIAADAMDSLKFTLLPLATLITPNAPEAESLAGITVASVDDQFRAADILLRLGAHAVLLKGGHLDAAQITDVLATPDGVVVFTAPRRLTRHTHGTGCTLGSAVATGLAQGKTLEDSVRRAHAYVQAALAGAPGFGAGHGPLDHGAGWQA